MMTIVRFVVWASYGLWAAFMILGTIANLTGDLRTGELFAAAVFIGANGLLIERVLGGRP